MSVYDDIQRELAAVPPEEVQAAVDEIEAAPWFTSWTSCPFGGWGLLILQTVHARRERQEQVLPDVVVQGGE